MKRHRILADASVVIEDKKLNVIATNISLQGLRFVCNERLPVNGRCRLVSEDYIVEILAKQQSNHLECTGEIKACDADENHPSMFRHSLVFDKPLTPVQLDELLVPFAI